MYCAKSFDGIAHTNVADGRGRAVGYLRGGFLQRDKPGHIEPAIRRRIHVQTLVPGMAKLQLDGLPGSTFLRRMSRK